MADKPFKNSITGDQSSGGSSSGEKPSEILRKNQSTQQMMNGGDGTVGSGQVQTAEAQAAASQAGTGAAGQKEREKRQAELRRAIQAAIGRMDAQLADIDARRGNIAKMLKGTEQVIDAINDGERVELDEDGNLKNKAAEEALREYEKRTGKKVDRTDPDALLEAMIIIQAELGREDRDLARKRDKIAEAKESIWDQPDTESVHQLEEETNLEQQAFEAVRRQSEIAATELVETSPLTSRPIEARSATKDSETAAYEFEKGFAEAAKIEDPTERMLAEKALVDVLSEENRRFVELSTDHYHIFESGYFDALDLARTELLPANWTVT